MAKTGCAGSAIDVAPISLNFGITAPVLSCVITWRGRIETKSPLRTFVPGASSTAPVFPVNRKNAKFARVIFGVQRELPGHFVAEANWVSAWGYDMPVARNLDFVPRQFLGTTVASDAAANTLLSATIPNPFRNLLPGTGSPLNTATTITRAQSLLPFPQFTNVWVEQYNGTNSYGSLQLQLTQRFSRDLTLSASYTHSRLRERLDYLNPSDTQLEDR